MQTVHIIAATAILVLGPLVWGLLMAYGTEYIKRFAKGSRGSNRD